MTAASHNLYSIAVRCVDTLRLPAGEGLFMSDGRLRIKHYPAKYRPDLWYSDTRSLSAKELRDPTFGALQLTPSIVLVYDREGCPLVRSPLELNNLQNSIQSVAESGNNAANLVTSRRGATKSLLMTVARLANYRQGFELVNTRHSFTSQWLVVEHLTAARLRWCPLLADRERVKFVATWPATTARDGSFHLLAKVG